MGIKKSVVISDDNIAYCEKHYPDPKTGAAWSYAVNHQFDLAREYAVVIRRLAVQLLPELTLEEWQYVLQAFSGCFHQERFRSPPRIASAVMNDYKVEVIDDCTPEFQAVIRKLASLSQPEQFAVREFAAWYWTDELASSAEAKSFNDVIRAFKEPFEHLLRTPKDASPA